MSFTDLGKKAILSCCFLGEKSPELYLAVYLKTSTGLEEIKGSGYMRIPLNDALTIDKHGVLSNKEDIVFAIAKKGWGVVSAIGIVNAKGDQFFIQPTIDPTPKVPDGKRLRIPAGMLSIKFT